MNLVGKIFTFLIFLMCIVFASFAIMVWTGHKNWREIVVNPATGLERQLADANATKERLLTEQKQLVDEKQKEIERQRARLASAETDAQLNLQEREAGDKKILDLERQLRDQTAGIAAVHRTLAVLRTEAENLSRQLKETEALRAEAFDKLVKVTDAFHNAVNERLRLEKQTQTLTAEVVQLREALSYNKIDLKGYKLKAPPADLEGEVTSALRPDYIEISVGADDGVRKGHKFEVVRLSNHAYVGRLEVIAEPTPNRAVCRPDQSMLRSPIQKGDHVYANLSSVK